MEMCLTVKSKRCGKTTTGVLLVCFSGVFLAGCAVGPDYQKPRVDVPDQWRQHIVERLSDANSLDHQWWENFDDPELTNLIEKASTGNLTARQAVLRINQARAAVDIAAGRYYPDVYGVGSYSRVKESENNYSSSSRSFSGLFDPTDYYSAGLDASWEIDVFGRISRGVESAAASYEANVENYHDTLVSLYAEIAINYANLRTTQKRLLYARKNIKIQQNTLKLTKDLYQAELVPGLDIEQAKLNLANTEALVPDLFILEDQILNRLAVLTGQYPGSLSEELKTVSEVPVYVKDIDVGLPVNLIRQRPDIRRTERQLAAQTAEIGVAAAELYPSFSLSGTFAYKSTETGNLFNSSSESYRFGPSMRWNLFSGGRIRSNVKLQKLLRDEVYLQYKNTVLRAVEEVENALVEYKQKLKRTKALAESVQASEKSTKLVDELYRNGLTDFQNVLDMQRTLSLQQDNLAQSRGDIIKSIIRIYKALGGGWEYDKLRFGGTDFVSRES